MTHRAFYTQCVEQSIIVAINSDEISASYFEHSDTTLYCKKQSDRTHIRMSLDQHLHDIYF